MLNDEPGLILTRHIFTNHFTRIIQANLTKGPPLRVYPLYSQLAQNRQMDVFTQSQPGTRRVIISTNIAETSLTIPGIKYVIDSGVVKQRSHDPTTGLDTLKVIRISQDQAWQRSGRAGREAEGSCYRTYTTGEFDAMSLSAVPEILRSNIGATVCVAFRKCTWDCWNIDSKFVVICRYYNYLPLELTAKSLISLMHPLLLPLIKP